MEVKELVFFNHYRNGDVFINRQYVKQIKSHFNVHTYYAHNNHESITRDLNITQISTSNLSNKIQQSIPTAYDKENKILFINTWVGAWAGKYFNWGEHPNFVTLHAIWKEYFDGFGIEMEGNYYDYLPFINLDYYPLKAATEWLVEKENSQFVLICNGQQQSEQSDMGNMRNIIDRLSLKFPSMNFLVCDKLDLVRENITYTDDLFGGPIGNLVDISYMSSFAKLIVGKNSGPFSFSHTYHNNSNLNQTFLCFSKEMKHCLAGEGLYYATHLFSNTTDDNLATDIITDQIRMIDEPRGNGMKPIRAV